MSQDRDVTLREVEHIARNVAVNYYVNPYYQRPLYPMPMILCAIKIYAPDLFGKALKRQLSWSDVSDFLNWPEWTRRESEKRQSNIPDMFKFALGQIGPESEQGMRLIRLGIDFKGPGIIIKETCEYINGFSSHIIGMP